MLEFTVVLALLLIFLMGIIEMSLVLYDKAMITNAAREGARFGSLFNADGVTGEYSPYSQAQIQAVVDSYLQDRLVSFGPASASVSATPATEDSRGQPRTVTVQYTYTFLVLPNFVNSFAGNLNLTAVAVMRVE